MQISHTVPSWTIVLALAATPLLAQQATGALPRTVQNIDTAQVAPAANASDVRAASTSMAAHHGAEPKTGRSAGLATVMATSTSNYVISTVAGSGTPGFGGDGGPAISAALGAPLGVAVDSSGNLFIAEFENERVRKVTPAGTISTVAGNGSFGFSGDGGPATSAALFGPDGVAVDSAGNLFIADSANARIRKVTPAGMISTVAGNGTLGFSGDGGPATSAELSGPLGVAVDSAGNLFIADGYTRVRKVTPAGTISTVAGNGIEGFSGDGGPATAAELYEGGVTVDSAGNLFIADTYNGRIRKVTPAGTISTVAGSGTLGFSGDGGLATSAELHWPQGVAVDGSGNLYIADNADACIRKVAAAGTISTVAGNGIQGFSGDGGAATAAQLWSPTAVVVDGNGNVFIADEGNNRIRLLEPAGAGLTISAGGVVNAASYATGAVAPGSSSP